jgi:hypothetical protein
MTEADLRAIALVRAVEQTSEELIPQTALVEATLVAGDRSDPAAWLARRARCLLDGALARFRPAVDHLELRVGLLAWILPAAFLLGLLGNYLGPAQKIHVLFNPITLLILWNLAVYVLLAVRSLRWARRPGAPATGAPTPAPAAGSTAPSTVPVSASAPRGGLLERALLGGLMRRVIAAQIAARRMWEGVGSASALVRAFVANWFATMRPALHQAARAALHLAAVGTALGAVAGMYVRGLFLDYAMIWRSTFINDPAFVGGMLRLALSPAAWILGDPVPTPSDAAALMTAEGSPAARWIHLLAMTVVLVIVVPRLALAAVSALAFRRATARLRPPLDDPYVADLLARAERLDLKEVQDGIRADVGKAFTAFADRLADFVAAELHAKRIEPALDAFRDTGGRLVDLEARLGELCRGFEPELRGEIGRQQRELERQVTERIAWRLGELAPQRVDGDDVLARIGGAATGASVRAGDRAGDAMVTGIGTVVSGAVAAVAGTVSGGFGHSLGTALLVGFVESGPVGWLLGAVVGAVVAAGTLYLGKDALRDGVKRVSLPAPLAKLALLRIDKIKRDGREQTRRMVRDELVQHFEKDAVIERTAEAIWSRLMPVLSERLRPDLPPS